jgi:putative hydrolase of the HAD superfamily
VECAVFDVDDTLYLERDYVISGFAAVGAWARANLGIDDLEETAWRAFLAGQRGKVFDAVLEAHGIRDDRYVESMVEVYRHHRPDITLEPDARRCLDTLHQRMPVAVVTDGPAVSQRAKIAALGLVEIASIVVVTDELGPARGKPHPLAFETVQAAAGVEGPRCTYVADNPVKDFAGPRSLGWRTVRVRRPGGLHWTAPSSDDVDVEVHDLQDLRWADP